MKRIIFFLLLLSIGFCSAQSPAHRQLFMLMNRAPATFSVVYDTDAVRYFNTFVAAGGSLNTTQKSALNNLIVSAKGNTNWWAQYAVLYPFLGGTAATNKINLRDSVNNALLVSAGSGFVGTPTSYGTFTAGIVWNGAYFDTKWNPSTAYQRIPQMTAVSTNLMYYSRTNSITSGDDIGTGGGGGLILLCGDRSGLGPFYEHGDYINATTLTYNTAALWVGTTTTNTTTSMRLYRNGVALSITQNAAGDAGGIPAASMFINGRNTGGGAVSAQGNRTCIFAGGGIGVSAAQAAQMATDLATFETAIGR